MQTDASGSLEAVRSALGALPQDSVVLRYLLATPNDITVSDIDLAAASKGTVLGFNVEPSEAVLAAAKKQGTAQCSCQHRAGSFIKPDYAGTVVLSKCSCDALMPALAVFVVSCS